MAHPYAHARAEHHARAHGMIERTGHVVPKHARGGAAHPDAAEDAAMIRKAMGEHDEQQHGGKHTKLKFKAGGAVEGGHAHRHLGKRARGGATNKGKHVTNVIVAPQGGGGMRPAMPPPAMQAAPRPVAPPPRPMAPPAAAPPPGAMPPGAGGPPMGMRPPGAMKRGGGVRHRGRRAGGGRAECDDEGDERDERARGGRTAQRVQEVGVPSESLMQAKKGGHVRRRDFGGSAGVPANPTQLNPQQVQRIAQIRRQQAQAQQAAARPPMQPPMSAAQAARLTPGNPTMQERGGEVHVKEHIRRARGGPVHMDAGAGGGEGRIEKAREYGSGRGFKPKKVPLHA